MDDTNAQVSGEPKNVLGVMGVGEGGVKQEVQLDLDMDGEGGGEELADEGAATPTAANSSGALAQDTEMETEDGGVTAGRAKARSVKNDAEDTPTLSTVPLSSAENEQGRERELESERDQERDPDAEQDAVMVPSSPSQLPQPPQSPLPSAAAVQGSLTDPNRPLNVTDALSYLDAVKLQFQDKPDVYNHFLDIMKDFKSQAIDTPGVINRVSLLFSGHVDLIQGFNTFLPPGYRIDCSSDDPSTITVTTPSGTTRFTTSAAAAAMGAAAAGGISRALQPPLEWPVEGATTSRPVTPQPGGQQAPGSPSLYASSTHAASFLGTLGNKGGALGIGAVGGANPPGSEEFHHAIQYVNKIKTRFEDDTETYKQFLEILHAYRKEQRSLDDSQVYAQVQVLFKDYPDLLQEFKDFLPPPIGNGAPSGGPSSALPAASSETFYEMEKSGWDQGKSDASSLVPAPKRRKRPIEKVVTPAPPPVVNKVGVKDGRTKKVKHNHNKPEPQSPPFSSYNQPGSPPPIPSSSALHGSHGHNTLGSGPGGPSQTHTTTSHLIQPIPIGPQSSSNALASGSMPGPSSSSSAQDQVMFFERAKKALEGRDAYEDFLKLLALFTREIIDTKTLIQRAGAFLGGEGDLLAQFKDLLGYGRGSQDGPPGSIRTWAVDSYAKPSRETEERCGPSYRCLPLSETKLACSGRDELCRSVLNDVWVSHPTWASEDSGFVSHKKNSYEEALHKSEEERHEYQYYIDIITRTIQLLRPLNERIQEMTAEERNAMRLPPDFGGLSKSIFNRGIKKVYGREGASQEILQALQECPAVAIPIVLPRLMQKSEEWRRSQWEWNRVWREVDARNFYKSLDHQGITFKANDKKNITTKSFVTEIENAKAEMESQHAEQVQAQKQRQRTKTKVKREGKRSCSPKKPPPFKHHLEYAFEDMNVMQDALKLVFSFLDRSQIQYSSHERRGVEKLLRMFVPLFFELRASEFDAAFGSPVDGDEDGVEDHPHHSGAGAGDDADELPVSTRKGGRRSAGGASTGNGGGVSAGDLRKKLLKTAQEKAAKAAATSGAGSGTSGGGPKAKTGASSASASASPSRVTSPGPSPPEANGKSSNSNNNGEDAMVAESSSSSSNTKKSNSKTANKSTVATTTATVTDTALPSDEWIKLMPVRIMPPSETAGESAASDAGSDVDLLREGLVSQRPFFANTTFYSLFRLLQHLYSRLLMSKTIGIKLASNPENANGFVVNPVAEELGLVDGSGPGAVLAFAAGAGASSSRGRNGSGKRPLAQSRQQDEDGMEIESSSSFPTTDSQQQHAPGPRQDRPETHFYDYLLESCEKVFEGDMDQATFEENIRFLFGTRAYHLFTLDKLIAALIKQAQTVVVDNKCQELLGMLGRWRSKCREKVTMREVMRYRREAEQYLGPDDHLYRVEWLDEKSVMGIQLLRPGDVSVCGCDGTLAGEIGRWRVYVDSFGLEHGTEGVDEGRVKRPYLQRCREDVCASVSGRLEMGVEMGTYRMVYEKGAEDVVWRVDENRI